MSKSDLDYVPPTCLFLVFHLPLFLLVRSSWYTELIPGWATFLHSFPFLPHYCLDLFFCMAYLVVGCSSGRSLRYSGSLSASLSSPFASNFFCIFLVTVVFNSLIGLVFLSFGFNTLFVTSFFPILLSDLLVILTVFLVSHLVTLL